MRDGGGSNTEHGGVSLQVVEGMIILFFKVEKNEER